jgi:hypothetical protein
MAFTVQQIAAEEDRKKTFNEQVKSVMTELEGKMNRLSNMIRNRAEFRDVDVDFIMLDDATIKEVRVDTGETIIVRPARPEEQQLAMDIFEAEEQAAQARAEQSQGGEFTATPIPESHRLSAPIIEGEAHEIDETTPPPEGPDPEEIEEETGPFSKIDLSTLRIRVPDPGDKDQKYRVTLGKTHKSAETLVEAVVKAFKHLGYDYDLPVTLAGVIFKKFPDSEERRQLLGILNPNDTPLLDPEA